MPISKWNDFLSEDELKSVGIIVCFSENDDILILRRSNIDSRSGQWTVPGGHIDEEDASIEAGAIRELEEETGLTCQKKDLVYLGDPKPKKYYFYTKEWSGDINISIPNPKTGEIEHDDYKWASINDIKDIANSEIPIYLLEKALDMSKNAK
jgi:8-oxo-dGTP pyrophosphatase MutT (NUDIX family)